MASLPRERSRASQNQSSSSRAQAAAAAAAAAAPKPTQRNDPNDMSSARSLNELQAGEALEVRTCWICQADETEDPPGEDVPWKKPCPCSLVAHEQCLLEWIADQEKPKVGEVATAQKIRCPQCKIEIKVERPRDLIVGFYDKLASTGRAALLPAAVSAVGGFVYSGLLMYGMNTFMIVFGPEEALNMLEMAQRHQTSRFDFPELVENVFRGIRYGMLGSDPFLPGLSKAPWKILLGLPAIAPALVLLRTKTKTSAYSFPLFLSVYIARSPWKKHRIWPWPPTPGLAFATIPYLRAAYSELYKYTFADLEKRWDLAVQRRPREGETAEDIAGDAPEANGIFQLEIIDQVDEAGIPVPERPRPLRRRVRQPADAQDEAAELLRQQRENEIVGAAQVAEEGPDGPEAQRIRANLAAPEEARNNENWHLRRNFDIAQAATTVMGALAFPAISACMGDVLNVVLPAKLVGRGYHMRFGPKGILKERWGRTIVGGCLFVVLKDAVLLYCKWKKAKDFGKRKIINYVKPDGRP